MPPDCYSTYLPTAKLAHYYISIHSLSLARFTAATDLYIRWAAPAGTGWYVGWLAFCIWQEYGF